MHGILRYALPGKELFALEQYLSSIGPVVGAIGIDGSDASDVACAVSVRDAEWK